jgi:hypothetical protein
MEAGDAVPHLQRASAAVISGRGPCSSAGVSVCLRERRSQVDLDGEVVLVGDVAAESPRAAIKGLAGALPSYTRKLWIGGVREAAYLPG